MKEIFVCENCGNTDLRYVGHIGDKLYCRRCLDFDYRQAKEGKNIDQGKVKLTITYPLTEKQQEVSDLVVSSIHDKRNVLIHAVTGAGKTELVFNVILDALKKNQRVGFATPRKDVVIDLLPRFKEAFKELNVIAVYGDNNEILEGDLIILTTHQLCHYKKYFDLLIIDEIDAFPFKGDFVLNSFFENSLTKHANYILLTATIDEKDKKEFLAKGNVIVSLNERFHKKDLIVPKFYFTPTSKYIQPIVHLKRLVENGRKVIVFAPTIALCYSFYNIAKYFVKNGESVSSKKKTRAEIIESFKKGELSYLVSTSILERGVTIKDLDVILIDIDNPIYSWQAIVQIAGRVGRKLNSEYGEVLLFGFKKTKEVDIAIETIKKHNREKNM